MRILLLNYRDLAHPMAGGAEVHLHRIFGRIAAQGHKVRLLTTHFEGAAPFEISDGIEIERFGNDLSYPLQLFMRIRRAEKEFKPDIIVEDINKLPFYSFLVSSKPKFLLFHHLWGSSIFKEASFPVAFPVWLNEQALRFCYTQYQASAVSPSTLDELKGLGFHKPQLHLIYNGSEAHWFDNPVCDPKLKAPSFLWLGRLRKYKGPWTALEAMKILRHSHPQIQLKIAGSGPELEPLRRAVIEWELQDQVQILGRVNDIDKAELLRNSMALIQSSFKEGWGLTVIEAAACGTPSIASHVAGLRDSVCDGQTGTLFSAGQAQELADAMLLYSENPELLSQYSRAALAHAQQFSWDTAANQTLKQLQLCLAPSNLS